MANPTTLITAETFVKMAGLTPPKHSLFQRMFATKRCSDDIASWKKQLNDLVVLYNKAFEADSEANELNHELQACSCAIFGGDFDFQGEIIKAAQESDSIDSAILKAQEILTNADESISQCKENLAKVSSAADELTTWVMQLLAERPEGKSVLVLKLRGTEPTPYNQERFYAKLESLDAEQGLQSISTCMFVCYLPIWIAIHSGIDTQKLKEYVKNHGFWVWTAKDEIKNTGENLDITWE